MASLRGKLRGGASYVLIACAVWLGWEVVKAPVAARAPAVLATRVAPQSPEVLRRAAEERLVARDFENARILAGYSLAAAPFNARALRVRGLAEAEVGNINSADEMLTLAGNWSLRDDPSHAWLVERRLQQGSYSSAFAHADTLARRRDDLQPGVFGLFTQAAHLDQRRALPALSQSLARQPPWRSAYLRSLYANENGPNVLLGLALTLQNTDGPFTDEELGQLYSAWVNARRFSAVVYLRNGISRPSKEASLQDGDFEARVGQQIAPFNWAIGVAPNLMAGILEDDLKPGNQALRLSYGGSADAVAANQVLTLSPGTYRLSGRLRYESALPAGRYAWSLRCLDNDAIVFTRYLDEGAASQWRDFSYEMQVPAQLCTVQRLQLEARGADRRANVTAWFDDLALQQQATGQR